MRILQIAHSISPLAILVSSLAVFFASVSAAHAARDNYPPLTGPEQGLITIGPYASNFPIVKFSSDSVDVPQALFARTQPIDSVKHAYTRINENFDTYGKEYVLIDILRADPRVTLSVFGTKENPGSSDKQQTDKRALLGQIKTHPEEALEELKAELGERRAKDTSDPGLGQSLNLIGYQCMLAGFYRDAERFLQDAIAMRESQGPLGRHALGQSICSLGELYLAECRLAEARPLIVRAIGLRDGDPSDRFARAKALIIYGRLLAAEGQLQEAEKNLQLAVEILGRKGEEQGPTALIRMAPFTDRMMQAALLSSASRQEKNFADVYYLHALVELADVYLKDKKLDEARVTIMTAVKGLPLHNDTAVEAKVYSTLARIETAEGKYADANANLLLAQAALSSNKPVASVEVDVNCAFADLSEKQHNLIEARDYYTRAADRLASMLTTSNARVIDLRSRCN